MMKTIENFVLDILFPISCLVCGSRGKWLCQTCSKKIELLSAQVCPYCEKSETPVGAICQKCQRKFIEKNRPLYLDNLIVSTKYKKYDISRLIHAFKYSFVQDLSLPLTELMRKALLDSHLPLPDIIIPVPLHPRRLRWRGFNQSQLLAEGLAENLSPGLPIQIMHNLVTRKKFTRPQMKIKNYQARKKNMQNSFELSNRFFSQKEIIKNKKILLVDDISTTGSTLLECAKILKMAGAERVFGVVIARQELK